MFPRLIKGAGTTAKPFKIDPNKVVVARTFRDGGPSVAPPETIGDYKPPSLIRRHGLLALLFVLACCGVIGYLVKALHAPAPEPAPASPIYVEPLSR